MPGIVAGPAVGRPGSPQLALIGRVGFAALVAGLAGHRRRDGGWCDWRDVAVDAAVGAILGLEAIERPSMSRLRPRGSGSGMADDATLGWVARQVDAAGEDVAELHSQAGIVRQAVIDWHRAPGLDRAGSIDEQ